jgi:HEAT repeat protein
MNKGGTVVMIILTFLLVTVSITQAQPAIPFDKANSDLPENLKKIIVKLYSPNPIKRYDAATELERLGPRAAPAVPFLAAMLADNAGLIWKVGQVNTISGRTSPGQRAACALASLGPDGVKALAKALENKRPLVRVNAMKGLGCVRDKTSVVGLLVPMMKDEQWRIRGEACRVLSDFIDPRALQALIAAKKDRNSWVRLMACRGLGWWAAQARSQHIKGWNSAITVLARDLTSARSDPLDQAVSALLAIGGPRVTTVLIEAVKRNSRVWPHITFWMKNGGWHARIAAVQTLEKLHDSRAVKPLIWSLNDRHSGVRCAAARALSTFGDPRARQALQKILKGHDQRLKRCCQGAGK